MFYKNLIVIFLLFSYLFGMTDDLSFNNTANELKFKGNVAEEFISNYFTKSGWKQLPGEYGGSGIDGLFVKVKNGVITDVMLAESKFKTKGVPTLNKNGEISVSKSGLSKTTDGARQMSKKWLLRNIDILIEKGDTQYREYYKQIRKHIESGNVRKRYFSMTKLPDGKIKVILKKIEDISDNEVKIVDNKRAKISEEIFDPNNPKTSREKKLAEIYNKSIEKNKKIFLESEKASTKFVKILTKGGNKFILKIGALSAMSILPRIGVAAQIAADMYMAYQIEGNSEKIDKNKQKIKQNRELIDENKKEIEILGEYVELNRRNIERTFQKINTLNDKINKLQKEIENDKKSKFQTGLKELQAFFNSNRQDDARLISAISKFDDILNNPNYSNEMKTVVRNALNIAEIEQVYIKRKRKEDTSGLENKILQNFEDLIKTHNLAIINNAFDSMKYVFINEKPKLKKVNTIYKNYLDKEIDSFVKNNRFEDALYIANLEKEKLNNSTIYKKVLSERDENLKKYKSKLTSSNILSILQKNQNVLLYKEAVKVAYKEDNIKLMLKILKNYPIKDNVFKLKAFYLAYRIINGEKAKKLKKLILTSPVYPVQLKRFVQNY